MEDDEVVESARAGSIVRQVGRALRWSLVGILVTKMASFAIGLALARLLTPKDFGVYAIALGATMFVIHINDVGIIAATVQWRGRFEDMAATAATLAFLFSVGLYAVVWIVAPWLCQLASSPDATPVVRLLTSTMVIDGITAVRSAALMRRFQQDKLIRANVAGFLVQAPVAIVLAMNGAGPYSFVVAQLAGAVVTGGLVFAFAKVRFELGFDREVGRKLLRFGFPLAASLGVEAILVNADYVIVGRLLGTTALGFYLLAFNVSGWVPSIITTGVRYVSVAGFSRLAEEEGSLEAGARRSIPIMVALVVPITVLTAILSPDLVAFLYGGTWAPAAPVLRFLMILMAARVLTSFAFDILTSAGATRATFWLNLGWAATLIPTLIISTHLDGIRGTAIGHALVGMIVAVPLSIVLLERAGVRLALAGPALLRPLVGAAVAAAVCLLVLQIVPDVPLARLVAAGGTGLLAYLIVVVPREALMRRMPKAELISTGLVQSGASSNGRYLKRGYQPAHLDPSANPKRRGDRRRLNEGNRPRRGYQPAHLDRTASSKRREDPRGRGTIGAPTGLREPRADHL
jgi:O-antigen/teichoic acid export membrane protein